MPKCPQGITKLGAEKEFLITIWYLSNMETLRQIADRFNVSESSVYRCLNRVINFIISVSADYIKWPSGETLLESVNSFASKQGLRGVIGAIDGTHVPIKAPQKHSETYINRKKWHSVILQGVVTANKLFVDVYCGEPGSLHDARVLRKSSLYSKLQNPEFYGDKFLIGDSAYPSTEWLVPPFRDNGHLSANQKEFNFRHSSTRIAVEHAFGLLKGRFRRLQHFENNNILFISKCVVASCVLHNICIVTNDSTEIEQFNDFQNINNEEPFTQGIELIMEDRRSRLFRELFNV